jgi:predicted ATPase
VAQIGAAIGRQFPYALLRAIAGLPEDALQTALAQLVASELVFQRGTPPEAVYTFKHALVQDAAHDSLLRNARRQLHAQIADVLENHLPELMDSQPELLAQHYAEAGLIEKSVMYWGKVGQRSVARSAMVEAVAQFQKGLDQLTPLPETAERQAPGARALQRPRRRGTSCERFRRAGTRSSVRPCAGAVGAAGFASRVPSHSLRPVRVSHQSRRS